MSKGGVIDNTDQIRRHFLSQHLFIAGKSLHGKISFKPVTDGFVDHGAAGLRGKDNGLRPHRRFTGTKQARKSFHRLEGKFFYNLISKKFKTIKSADSFIGCLHFTIFFTDKKDIENNLVTIVFNGTFCLLYIFTFWRVSR